MLVRKTLTHLAHRGKTQRGDCQGRPSRLDRGLYWGFDLSQVDFELWWEAGELDAHASADVAHEWHGNSLGPADHSIGFDGPPRSPEHKPHASAGFVNPRRVQKDAARAQVAGEACDAAWLHLNWKSRPLSPKPSPVHGCCLPQGSVPRRGLIRAAEFTSTGPGEKLSGGPTAASAARCTPPTRPAGGTSFSRCTLRSRAPDLI